MPSGLIDEKDGMGFRCDPLGDFREVQVQRLGASVLQAGRIRATPVPCFGQMAPKI